MIDMHATASTVLVVDDNPNNLGFLFEHLERSGFRVLVALSGDEALTQLDYAQPDLILLDILMPELDGFATCQRIKRLERTHDIPVIFMSALDDPRDKVRAFAAGAVDYVTKPVNQDEILARIHTQVSLRMLQRELEARNLLLEQQSAELRERNVALQAFGHMVAHDLRNGLSRILAFTDLMQREADGEFTPQQVDDLATIHRAGLDMAEIIDALTILAGISQKNVPIGPLDMHAILARVELALATDLARRNIEVRCADDWPVALGYAPWIERVWMSYASIGLQHGDRGGRFVIGADRITDGMIRFWLRDSGPGIPEQQRVNLFEPFAHVFDGMAGGRGLDLTIVQRMIGKLGGAVGCQPWAGGNEFHFTLYEQK